MDDKYTSITGELRRAVRYEVVDGGAAVVELGGLEFERLCDNIDAIDTHLGHLCECTKRERDAALAELERVSAELEDTRHEVDWMHAELHGWKTEAVKLPVDADGVVIEVGDVVERDVPFPEVDGHWVVDELELFRDAEGYGWKVILDNGEPSRFATPHTLRHHHASTVEDVLREFAKAWDEWKDGSPYYPITKYADRLREVLGNDRD